MRLGGFVIFGNARSTLGACLDDLVATCDRVLAVDSHSTDDSSALVKERGVEYVDTEWRGFGAARALAAATLKSDCDYLFFLDADEHLAPGGIEALRRWKAQTRTLPIYRAKRRNWAMAAGKRFIYRTDVRARLVRSDCASWTPRMVIHEALPRLESEDSGVVLDHAFALHEEQRHDKDARYALLWAVQERNSRRGLKPAGLQRWAHFARDALFGGAVLRGGIKGGAMAWRIAHYHALKYTLLRAVREGAFDDLSQAFESGDLSGLFRAVGQLNIPARIHAAVEHPGT